MLHRRRSPLLLAGLTVALVGLTGTTVAQTLSPARLPATGAPAGARDTQGDGYTISGVKVDVSAANASEARDRAIREAQSKAWVELHQRLTSGASPAPRVSDQDLARLVLGFGIDDEKVSATRYIGEFSVSFRPNAVRDMLGLARSSYVEPPKRPYVLLPVTIDQGRPVLWDDRTAWRDAWDERQDGSSLVPLVVPMGELTDVSAISAADALSGNREAIARIAERYEAAGVVVARTELPAEGAVGPLSVEVTRYGLDGARDSRKVDVRPDAADRPNDLIARAVTFTAAAVDESWRRDNVQASGPEQTTLARIPLYSLNDWVQARNRLGSVSALSRFDVVSLNRFEAVVSLVHRGNVDQLVPLLARRGLSLGRDPAAMGGYPPAGSQGQGYPPPVGWVLSLGSPSGGGNDFGAAEGSGSGYGSTSFGGGNPNPEMQAPAGIQRSPLPASPYDQGARQPAYQAVPSGGTVGTLGTLPAGRSVQ